MSEHDEDQQSKGQVSEVSDMSDGPSAIDPSDATAGAPEGESGRPQEGTAGPDASPDELTVDGNQKAPGRHP
jgi:hypothetical protein